MEETKKKDGRGGKRPGAGRPPKAKPEPKIERRGGKREGAGRKYSGGPTKVGVNCYVTPRTRELCKQLHERGFMYSAMFEREILKAAAMFGLLDDGESVPTE